MANTAIAPVIGAGEAAGVTAAHARTEPARKEPRRGLLSVAREPFLHFLLLGTALFGISQYLETRSQLTRIVITPKVVQGIVANYQLQYGMAPAPRQLDALVDAYIREEVFYHEALRLGLDRDDEIIRRRLVQKYEFVQQDLDLAQEPTDDALRVFFQSHAGRYELPAAVTFSHIYFSTDARGEEGARADASRVIGTLTASGVTRAPDQGDRFPGPVDFAAVSQDALGRVFGHDGLAEEVFRLEPNRWSGPIRSGLGWHLVYLHARRPASAQNFAAVRDEVRRDDIEETRERRNTEAYEKLKRGFVIVRE